MTRANPASVEGLAPADIREAYYTGKNINATSGSRTAISEDILPGYVVCFDPYGHDKGRGRDVTKAETAILDRFAGIVQSVPLGAARGGFIKLFTGGADVRAWVKANAAAAPATRVVLGPVNGEWGLGAITPSVASGVANYLALAQAVALANEAADTSSTAAFKQVHLLALGAPRM